jgi:hypothetical protein
VYVWLSHFPHGLKAPLPSYTSCLQDFNLPVLCAGVQPWQGQLFGLPEDVQGILRLNMHNDSHAHVDALKTQIRDEGREIRVLLECCHAPRWLRWWYWWQHALVFHGDLRVAHVCTTILTERLQYLVSAAAMVPGALVPVPVHPRHMGACHSLIVPAGRSVLARPVINRRAVPIHSCYWSSKSVQSSKPKQVWSSTQVCKLPSWKLWKC